MGNITPLLKRIKPAVDLVRNGNREQMNDAAIEETAVQNVKVSIDLIRELSPLLSEMEKEGQIEIVGALYDVETGVVEFFDDDRT